MRKNVIRLIVFMISFVLVFQPGWLVAGGLTIKEVRVQGNTVTSTDAVLGSIKSRAGYLYSSEDVQADIKSLYGLGQFGDISVDKKSVDGGIVLTFIVSEKPVISKISFSGNKKIKTKTLAEDVKVRAFKPLSEADLAESIQIIKDAYMKKGYYLVEIGYHIQKMDNSEQELVFDIKENKEAAVRTIKFVGNHVFNDKKLKGIIRTKEKSLISWLYGGGKLKDEQLQQDLMMLTFHYLKNGYLKVKVGQPRIEITKDKRHIIITYLIEEGKQYKVGSIAVQGDILTTPEELRAKLKIEPGKTYNQELVEQDIEMLSAMYGNEGYAFATIRPIPTPDDETEIADMTYFIEKGRRITVERINITGNNVTRDKVVRREMRIKEGDIYNEKLVQQSKERIMQLGYFEDVNFSTPRGTRDDTLVLNVQVKEKPTGTFNVGAGYSTSESILFTASISKQNFFGRGISGTLSADVSKRRQDFFVSMNDPYFLDSEWMVGVTGFRQVYKYTDFDRKSYGGDLRIGHRFLDVCALTLGYHGEQVEMTNFNYSMPDVFKNNASGLTSAVNLNITQDTRDNVVFPQKGMYNTFYAEVSGTKLGGQNDFWRLTYNSRYYQPIKWGIVVKANAQIGYMNTLGDRPIPLYERFFTGGVNSLRGFYPLSIGPSMRIPRSPTGGDMEFIYGGNKLLLFNLETQFPIVKAAGFYGVAFFDAGNAFAEQQNYSLSDLRADYGFGFRWQSPMGPLRFEWGFPINRRPWEDKYMFNFTIGSFF